ncbi:MAG TPA: lamin tail domain-containing protein, partial [Pyrinomonadaceae bacterium]
AGAALAQATYTTGFESPGFTSGDVNGQQGWGHISNSPTKGVIESTPGGSPAAFGAQLLALRTRNVDFFGVSNHLFSATIDPAGETGSTVGGVAVAQPVNHFAASFHYRTPATPVVSTRADGRFAELDPSSKGAGAEDVANRYAQVRVVNVNNTGNLRFEIGWYTSTSFTFCVQTAAENLTWGAWYRLEYDILFFDGLNGTRPNDVFRFSVYDTNNNLVGAATGSTWEAGWKTGGFGGGTTARAVNGFDLWSQTGPNDALVGLIDNFSMASNNVTFAPADLGSVKISEYRLRGPAGATDEFVELYNNTDAAIIVSDPTPPATGPAGWALVSSDDAGAAKFVVPNGTVIPARGHYLVANSAGYSLSAYPAGYACNVASTATPDDAYTTDIPDLAPGTGGCAAPFTNGRGLALFRTSSPANFTLANRLDAAGSVCETNALFKEGAGHAVLDAGASGAEHTWFRKLGLTTAGRPQDTGANAADFLFADTAGTSAGAGQRLGAPGPENTSSPVERNAGLVASLIDPAQPAAAPPNRARDFTSDPANNSAFGTLSVRRRFTNTTGLPVTRLRFRVIDITTFAPAGTADIRARTSADVVVSLTGGGTTTVRGTTLEAPPPAQAHGGGFNSSLSAGVVTLAAPLAPGATIDVQWLLGIQQTGAFRFYVNIEALP